MTEIRPQYGGPPKQLSIRLSQHLHRELKAKCAMEGTSIKEGLESLIRAYLRNEVQLRQTGELN